MGLSCRLFKRTPGSGYSLKFTPSLEDCIKHQYHPILPFALQCVAAILLIALHICSKTDMRQRSKLKTASIQVRVEPSLKAAAEKAAILEHRTLTNWIEVLIIGRCKELNVDAASTISSETHT